MFGPVSSSSRRSGDRSQSFGTNGGTPRQRGLHHRMPPGRRCRTHRYRSPPAGTSRRLPPAARRIAARPASPAPPRPRNRVASSSVARDQLANIGALPRRRPVRRLGDAPVQVGQRRMGEARPVGHALAQDQLRDAPATLRPPPPAPRSHSRAARGAGSSGWPRRNAAHNRAAARQITRRLSSRSAR